MGRVDGKVAIVTGAAQGIGAAYVRGLAREGAAVCVSDLLDPQPLVDEIRRAGGKAIGTRTDVTDRVAVEAMVKATTDAFGAVDILVNNAALFTQLPRHGFMDIASEEWDRVMAVNTRGVFECSRAVVPEMRKRGGGKIVNICSTTVHMGANSRIHYVASKGAVLAMTRAMAREFGPDKIAVNGLAPGLTMSEGVKANPLPIYANAVAARAFKREQLPEDLVGPLLFLVSADSDFVTGQTYVVDGGAFTQ
jgi:NAD(P)-dependent dehydrogenase (short-subunit alcohol dehydrogenase family)